MRYHFEGFPPNAHPMAILSAMINATSCFHPELLTEQMRDSFVVQAARLLSKVRTIAAFSYRKSCGLPAIYPKPELKYTANFLHMMFSLPNKDYDLKPETVKALDLIFLLHADHEQNCSTATVRMVASSHANLFASAAAGVCALWGPCTAALTKPCSKCSRRFISRATTAPSSSPPPRTRTAASG
jgi:citrate synthase